MTQLTRSQTAVLLERHLEEEFQVVGEFQNLAAQLTEAVVRSQESALGAGPVQKVETVLAEFAGRIGAIRQQREKVLQRIRPDLPPGERTLRKIADDLEPAARSRLLEVRRKLLAKTNDVRAEMLANTATAYYAFDFYRRLVAGIVPRETPESSSYASDGRSSDATAGNLLGKAC